MVPVRLLKLSNNNLVKTAIKVAYPWIGYFFLVFSIKNRLLFYTKIDIIEIEIKVGVGIC